VGGLSILHYVRAEHQRALELAEETLDLAQQVNDPLLVTLGHWQLGFLLFCLGKYAAGLGHLEQVLAFYSPKQHHHSLVMLRGSDPGPSALAYAACCLWCLGYPDQAAARSQQAIALARELGHPFTLADVLAYGGCLFSEMRRDAPLLQACAEELRQLATEKVQGWMASGTWYWGEALARQGFLEDGIAAMREGLERQQDAAELCNRTGCLCSQAEAQGQVGRPEDGLNTLAKALLLVEQTDERYYEPELHRLHAELLLAQGDEAEAEVSLHSAMELARRQQAKSWELRAALSLARLWGEQGRVDEARRMLAEVYDWFTEGFDTPDLQEARALLEALA
jgi:adenylate cyclase